MRFVFCVVVVVKAEETERNKEESVAVIKLEQCRKGNHLILHCSLNMKISHETSEKIRIEMIVFSS